jgi:hypothetical protein
VTNSVQHAHDAEAITVSIMRRGTVVHIDVIDDGTAGLPHWREAGGLDEGGRGFHLVNMIADRWGFLREQGGTCVWFELVLGLHRRPARLPCPPHGRARGGVRAEPPPTEDPLRRRWRAPAPDPVPLSLGWSLGCRLGRAWGSSGVTRVISVAFLPARQPPSMGCSTIDGPSMVFRLAELRIMRHTALYRRVIKPPPAEIPPPVMENSKFFLQQPVVTSSGRGGYSVSSAGLPVAVPGKARSPTNAADVSIHSQVSPVLRRDGPRSAGSGAGLALAPRQPGGRRRHSRLSGVARKP